MKKLAATLALVFLALVFANYAQTVEVPTESPTNIDTRFDVLMHWGVDLSEKASSWNKHCGNDKPDAGCNDYRDFLHAEMKAFIGMANGYKSEGDDCSARLRARVIAHEIRLFSWNISCAGQKPNATCDAEGDKILTEIAALKNAVQDCVGKESSTEPPTGKL